MEAMGFIKIRDTLFSIKIGSLLLLGISIIILLIKEFMAYELFPDYIVLGLSMLIGIIIIFLVVSPLIPRLCPKCKSVMLKNIPLSDGEKTYQHYCEHCRIYIETGIHPSNYC